jgi:uncharacterized protein YkwD
MRVAAAAALLAICGPATNFSVGQVAPQDALSVMRSLRLNGCGAGGGVQAPLHVSAALNVAAAQWSHGSALQSAIEGSGYRQDQSAGLHVAGDLQTLRTALSQRLCVALTDAAMIDAGILQRQRDIWIILAAPFAAPPSNAAGSIASDVLRLVNAARAQPQRCGHSGFPPAPALQLNELLTRAALAHAQDMLRFNYFEHLGHDGSTPAQRVAASGYDYRLVGENLAMGPETPQEAVRGWLASPGHCQNIMDPRFVESGIAFAATRSGAPRIYWAQEFAAAREHREH